MSMIQSGDDLDRFYVEQDPWGYANHPDDGRRKIELLSLIPLIKFRRTLDIGCGNGFLTFDLPGLDVVGVDISAAAVSWAEHARNVHPDGRRFSFFASSLFDLDPEKTGSFDLIVITGVLYPQYIGKTASLARQKIDSLLEEGGVLVSCHISEWHPPRFPYNTLDVAIYPYRNHTHRLEIYRK